MTQEEREKLLSIRKRGKTSKLLSENEFSFCQKMWEKYPEEYKEVCEEIRQWISTSPWYELL